MSIIDFPEQDGPLDLDELNRMLAEVTARRNRAPDPEMGDLSPDQVTGLIYTEWGAPGSSIQFRTDAGLPELAVSPFFVSIRTLLREIEQRGGVAATKTKNLNRKFVEEMLPKLCDERTIADIRCYYKAVNEDNVGALHYARIAAEVAGMLNCRKGRFSVPKSKVRLLADANAGSLYTLLLGAYFLKYNLAYQRSMLDAVHGLQACVGYTLYRLGLVAREWVSVNDLAPQVLLPAVREQIQDFMDRTSYWTEEKILTGCLLDTFVDWGLLEERHIEIYPRVNEITDVRIAPLYDRVLSFRV